MDPVTSSAQAAAAVTKALAEAQNVQTILAIVVGVLLFALVAVCFLYWKETRESRGELKKEQDDRRKEVRELFEAFTTRIEALAKALDAEHDRSRAIGGPVDDDGRDQANKSGARRRV